MQRVHAKRLEEAEKVDAGTKTHQMRFLGVVGSKVRDACRNEPVGYVTVPVLSHVPKIRGVSAKLFTKCRLPTRQLMHVGEV